MKDSPRKKERILVVDDERALALTLKAILQYYGYEVATAFSGEEAVVTAASFVPDLLLCDIYMGNMDGIEAATQITAKLPRCKVLFLSGHLPLSQTKLTSTRSFTYELASKPVPPPELIKIISGMLASSNTSYHVVLTVMHDDILRFAIAAKLTEAGFIVKEAKTGAEALDVIQGSTVAEKLTDAGFVVKEVGTTTPSAPVQNKPDAMVLDVLLPDTLGFEVHRTIVQFYPEMARVPVVYLALPELLSQAERAASEHGSAKALALPVEPGNLVAVLKTLLNIDSGAQLSGPSSAS